MAVELTDLLGVLAVAAYLAGMGAVTVRVLLLRRAQRTGRGVIALALLLLALAYIGAVLLDAPGVLAALSNGVDDIPPASTGRTGLFAAWVWVLHAALLRLAHGRTPS